MIMKRATVWSRNDFVLNDVKEDTRAKLGGAIRRFVILKAQITLEPHELYIVVHGWSSEAN